MKVFISILLVVYAYSFSFAQHTFSIVAVDAVTGEIGSAGATCGDSIVWPTTKGAVIISDIIPGVGAIHTQALYISANQNNARNRMTSFAESPQQIINYLQSNDAGSNPAVRQYGIVDYNNGSPRSAAFTGANCLDYKNHITGPDYSIQGNILLSQAILDSMEAKYLNTTGSLAERLMAAMQGAKVIGADTRCTPDGVSSLSSFLRVAKPTDSTDLFIDLVVAGTADGVDPIDALQNKYNNWKINNPPTNIYNIKNHHYKVYPSIINKVFYIDNLTYEWVNVTVHDMHGKLVYEGRHAGSKDPIDSSNWPMGSYIVTFKNHYAVKVVKP